MELVLNTLAIIERFWWAWLIGFALCMLIGYRRRTTYERKRVSPTTTQVEETVEDRIEWGWPGRILLLLLVLAIILMFLP